jgi:hypothetical protein
MSRLAIWLPLLGIALLAADTSCGGKNDGNDGCPAGSLADEAGECQVIGVAGCAKRFVDSDGVCRPLMKKCAGGTIPQFEEGCSPVGIPSCDKAFAGDDGLCHPASAACPMDSLAIPQHGCVPIDGPSGCGAGTWGNLADSAGTVYVDGVAGADSGDGTKSKPLRTLAAALALAPDGGRIALGAGQYAEAPVIARSVEIAGRCPSMVAITGNDGDPALPTTVHVTTGTVTIRGVRIGGDGVGLFAEGDAQVTLSGVLVDGALGAGVSATKGATLSITGSIVRGTRGEDSLGISGSAGASVTIDQSMVAGGEHIGIGVTDHGTSLTVRDSLVEGAGKHGVVVSSDAAADLRASAITGAARDGLRIKQAQATAAQLVVEGNGEDGVYNEGDCADTRRRSTLVLSESAVLKSTGGGVTADCTNAQSEIRGTLIADTQSVLTTDLTFLGVLSSGGASVTVTDSAIVRSRLAGMLADNALLEATRVLVEDSLPDMDVGTYGVGFGASRPGAYARLDSVVFARSRVAGLLVEETTDPKQIRVSHCLFTDTTAGKSLDEQSSRAGVLFADSTGAVRLMVSTKNRFGAVFDGAITPPVDTASAFLDNMEEDVVRGRKLVVPSAPPAIPAAP